MTTTLVISVTDELVAELEAIAEDASFVTRESDSQEYLANLATRLLAERAELLRDAERLDWFIKECCVMECMNGSAWPVMYRDRRYWSHEAEGRREWHASPRAAIDAAMQSEAKP
jgi:hypothetical protein